MPRGQYERKPREEMTADDGGFPSPVTAETVQTLADAGGAVLVDDLAAFKAQQDQLARELEEVRALKARLELKTEIRTEVASAISEQQMEQRRRDFGRMEPAKPEPMPPMPEGARLITVKLDRHYRPKGYYEIVGYHKDAVFKKRPDGQVVEVEKAEFIAGQTKPPAIAGVGFQSKIWSGTVLRLVDAEARTVRSAGIGSIELD